MGKDGEEDRQGKEYAQDQQSSPANLAGRGDVQEGYKRGEGDPAREPDGPFQVRGQTAKILRGGLAVGAGRDWPIE